MTTLAERRRRQKGRATNVRFVKLPHEILNHAKFTQLSHRAIHLLIDLMMQFNGTNNGDFQATLTFMRKRGWNSNDQISKACKELLTTGWIVKTRQGHMPKVCNLYAVTFHPIDECRGKLDVSSTTKPLDYWKCDGPHDQNL